ncbi:hypothetical protein B0H17DRAFT_1089819 [Mycena rosella]|uniref:Uncharacterized protein n=1 Tax=Mycena rosella TaxID=1033263 RepID=A0AAD7G4V2_MYCRO|nr:hypothetical protein B0H17DRAFT_1089819 [Mycena rosella]
MANADTLTSSLPELTPGNVAEEVSVARDISPEDIPVPASPPTLPVVDADPAPIPLVEPNPVAPVRSSLVPLGSQAAATAVAPQPKRFSAVNINKKFLEKNSSSSSTSAPTSSNSAASKAGGPISRPQAQPTASHSRLVTTKLTAAPQTLSPAGPVNGSTAPATSASGDPATASGASQHAGSAIQSQPRPLPARGGGSRESVQSGAGVGKPVWGKPQQQQRPDMTSQSDFPTAAEVAAAPRKSKPTQADRNLASKEAAALEMASAAANKQARMEEADTFRGVHLDPNAHHWDEMEEDDDNFLDGVIEFGDGRQYKIESADLPADLSSATLATSESVNSVTSPPRNVSRSRSRLDEARPSNVPVSKEERFADDFDRSWPRSRTSPAVSTRDLPAPSALSTHSSSSVAAPSPVSPAISLAHGLHSPQDSPASRALLFNERSNKLEPYNRAAGAAGAGQKRPGDGFPSVSPTDTRGREFPPVQPGNSNNVQLLQNRGRGFSGTAGGFNIDRQQSRRDGMPAQQTNPPMQNPHVPANPWMQRKDTTDGPETRGRRLSAMGPPPVPAPAAGLGALGGRQRPPHLPLVSGGEADVVPVRPQRRPSTSRESRLPPSTTPAAEPPTSARRPSQSPALSHASAVPQSPVMAPVVPAAPQLSGPDLDEVRKDVMQSAAARAKARRQQEEEEREKEKERARRKAAEIEEKIRAVEAEKAKAKEAEKASHAQDVLDIIETAVKGVEVKPEAAPPKPVIPVFTARDPRPPVRRPSLMGPPVQPPVESRPVPPRRTSSSSAAGAPVLPPVQTGSSWRSKASPTSATVPTPVRQVQPRPPIPSFAPPPSALDQVESLAENPEEELEVVDFSDLGKFIGVTEEETPVPEQGPITPAPYARPPRPVASDFFDDRPSRSPEISPAPAFHEKTNLITWRRQGVPESVPESEPSNVQPDEGKDRPRNDVAPEASFTSEAPTGHTKDISLSSVDHHSSSPVIPVPPHANRTPRSQPFYKEATMSTLDDVMSRIKGAIDGMQTSEREHRSPEVSAALVARSSVFLPSPAQNPSVQKERWVPPAFRTRQFDAEPEEVIVTGYEPPRSPKPAWNAFIVRLPKISQPLEPVNRKQLLMCTRPTLFRWDVLSFDPPVEGMSRKEFTVNEILFRRPGGFKGKNKYKVLLPIRKRRVRGVNGVGAFGRPSADGLSTWRKPLSSASANFDFEPGLNTMSRSPPPELPSDANVASIPRTDVLTPSKSEDVFGPSRSRSQPKLPAGSAVGFYRGARVDTVEPDTKPPVNFFVSSELEDSRQNSENNTPSKGKPSIMVSSPASNSLAPGEPLSSGSKPFTPRANGIKPSPSSSPEIGVPSLISNSKAESKSSDDSTDRTPITPPSHHTASWARTSLNLSLKDPLRGPDPEHLKAVWSQTSNKAGLHTVNSLEGIADDLTAIPFTLQDVKSEDGGTPPPPTSIASSRMSLHDVTRAFQQVPSSSSSSSLRPPISPPSTSAPVARPPTYSYPLQPPPNQMMRPNYGPYSPMMSSPSPTMIQPVWMAQNHGGMMRPMGSPYPQLMPYPTPAGTPMYAPQPQPMQPMQNAPQQPNGPRGRSMSSVMSPVMPHQNAMYPGSPILMHAPPMPVGYMNMPPGRGQMRNDNGHQPMQQQQHQQQQQQHPQHQPNGHPMHPSGYNPVPSTSFVRPTW